MMEDYLEDVRDKIISEELEKRISWIETDLNNRLADNPLASRFTPDKSADIARLHPSLIPALAINQ